MRVKIRKATLGTEVAMGLFIQTLAGARQR
jgi:hypothetical protein